MTAEPVDSAGSPVMINARRTIHALAMYAWTSSAYALAIVSAIFPAYYLFFAWMLTSSRFI